ncbi:MAG: ycdD [Bryobacterales bacterium]|nr:ycdD [Bryobacterales bacterium]
MDKLALVHPTLADRVRQLFAKLKAEGYEFIATQGLRTWEEQNALYAKGRTVMSDVSCTHDGVSRKPGTCATHPLGATVTKAPGGHSQHNFGLAVDVTAIDKGIADWNLSHPAWKRMLELAPSCLLAEGAEWRTFPDNPHLYPVEIPATCEVLREKYALGGVRGVWAWFESLCSSQI